MPKWLLTCFYGNPYTREKVDSWNNVQQLARTFDFPWIVLGDCTVVLHREEKKSSFPFNESEARTFNNTISKCGLMDLGFIGYTFTWNNRRFDDDFIEERLDRALVNSFLNISFPNSSIRHLGRITSDHVPICLNTHNTWNDGATPFKYNADWMKHEDCKPLIQNYWDTRIQGSHAFVMTEKLSSVKKTLGLWNKTTFGNIRHNIDLIKKNLDQTNRRHSYRDKAKDLAKLTTELSKWYAIQEKFWKVKSRDQDLALGDRNTKYFHIKEKKIYRKKQNRDNPKN